MHTVHVRVNDAATGQPTPVRIRFSDDEGRYYAPFGRLTEFAVADYGVDVGGNVEIGGEEFAFIDGTCEINLPAAPITVEVHKGYEYTPLVERVTLGSAKLALRLAVERWTDLRAEGWYSGDTWTEALTPHAALLEAVAEDVAVVNVLACAGLVWGEDGRQHGAIPNILAFSGQEPALQQPGHLVVVNTLNWHARLGRLALLNCHRVVYPLTFGDDEGADDWTLADWCDQCHRKSGLVVGHDFFGTSARPSHGEVLADLILGKIDALELNASVEHPENPVLGEWQALLDAGFRVPLVRGSGKANNLTLLGERRTYARLGEGQVFNYKNWIEAVRAGRTFVTNGPLLSFTVNGHDPGAVIPLPAGSSTVQVRASVRSLVPFDRLEIVGNGKLLAEVSASGSPCQAALEVEVPVSESGWLAARCRGAYDGDVKHDWIGAQTSPVYLEIDGRPRTVRAELLAPFVVKLDHMRAWVAQEARCSDDKQRQRLDHVFASARQELLRRQNG